MAHGTSDDDAMQDLLQQYDCLTSQGSPPTTQRDVIASLADIIADDNEMRGLTARLMMPDIKDADAAVAKSNLLYGSRQDLADYLVENMATFLTALGYARQQHGRKPFSEHDLEQWENEAADLYDATRVA